MKMKLKETVIFKAYLMMSLLLILLLSPGNSMAEFNLKVEPLNFRLNAYVMNETGVRFQDHLLGYANEGDLSLMRSTLQLEPKLEIGPAFSFKGVFRASYEGMFDLDWGANSIDQRPRHRMLHEADMREYYVNANFGKLSLHIGRQQLVWGESDLFRMGDVVNPLDMSWHYVLPPFEDIRIGRRMAVIDYKLGWHDMLAELVLIPEDFQPTKFAREGANWFPPAFLIPGLYDVINKMIHRDKPSSSLHNFEAGLRLKGKFGAWDLSTFYLYKRSENPILVFALTNPPPTLLEMKFPKYSIIGGTFNVFDSFTKTVFRGETAFNIRSPYTEMDIDPLLGVPVPTLARKNTWAFMLGFDRPTFLGWPEGRTVFISGQIFQKFIFNSNDRLSVGDMENRKRQTIFTLTLNTTLGQGNKFTPQFLIGFDPHGSGGSGLIWPSLKYAFNDHLSLTLNATYLWGHSDMFSGYFSPYRKNSEAWLQIKYSL